jgi:hypothetical protein
MDPRRSYSASAEDVMAWTPDGIDAECPTQAQFDICTAEIEILGMTLPNLTGWHSHDCTDSPFDCEVSEGQCAWAEASSPLPINLRKYSDYIWQRNPFTLARGAAAEGKRQYAGSDYSVPYWNARRYGFVTEGQGHVLAWQPTEEVCE